MTQEKTIRDFLEFLDRLKDAKIFYKLSDPTGALMVEAVVPGERWEIEFHNDGQIGVEVFKSNGPVQGPQALEDLFKRFSN